MRKLASVEMEKIGWWMCDLRCAMPARSPYTIVYTVDMVIGTDGRTTFEGLILKVSKYGNTDLEIFLGLKCLVTATAMPLSFPSHVEAEWVQFPLV